jgi:hypothetical protein
MENIVYYPGVGKPCPDCLKYLGKEIFFSNSHDLACHRRVCDTKVWKMGWKKNPDGTEWCSTNGGKVILDGKEITVSANGKWFKRKSVGLLV